MTEVAEEDDDYEEGAPGPSLALPPIYALRATARCPACGEALHVYTLGCAAWRDAGDSRQVELFHFLILIESVPDGVMALLTARCPGYYLDLEEGQVRHYLMNHCRCGAALDDEYLHGDVGAAFWPDTPEGFRQFALFRLPVEGPIPIVGRYTIGGGEYLDTEHAEAW